MKRKYTVTFTYDGPRITQGAMENGLSYVWGDTHVTNVGLRSIAISVKPIAGKQRRVRRKS